MSKENRVTKSFCMDAKSARWIERHAKRMNVTQSDLLDMCIQNAMDDWKLLEVVGLKPEYIPAVRQGLKALKENFIAVHNEIEQGLLPPLESEVA